MKLFEHEGKDLFEVAEIPVLKRFVVDGALISSEVDTLISKHTHISKWVVKAQTLSGKRGKRGLVKVFEDTELMSQWVKELIKKKESEQFSAILIEKAVAVAQELFVSITYSTKSRGPVLLFSSNGGMEVEEMEDVLEYELEIGSDVPKISNMELRTLNIDEKHLERLEAKIWDVVQKLWELFQERDLFLAEINPLAITSEGKVYALDSKVVTDDAAHFRQEWDLPERNMFGTDKSWAELEAEKIDAEDHRGAVGRVYLDLEGDIGVIAAGGGASLVAMDAMVGYGLKPANYTEFSGNPPQWKVKRLTEIVLAKENLKGAVLIGGKANFTDQVETLSGFLEALEDIDPKYPIVVRRDGPRMDEAKKMLEEAAKKHGWPMEIYDSNVSIIDAVKKLEEFIDNY